MVTSSIFLSQLNRSWDSHANSLTSRTESLMKTSMMSLACTSMMMSWFTFFLSSFVRSERTMPVRSTSCWVSFPEKSFMAYLFPSLTLLKTSSTSQVHQTWLPRRVIIPRLSRIHLVRLVSA